MMKLSSWAAVAWLLTACATPSPFGGDDASTNPDASSPTGACAPCLSDSDCNGGSCAQLGGDSFCSAKCTTSAQCPSGESCISVTSTAGDQVSGCVDTTSTTCGPMSQPNPPPGSDGGTPTGCPGWASPTMTGTCHSCTSGSNGCQPNGCYGGWWCNTSTVKCQSAPPPTCTGSSDGGAGGVGTIDAGSFTSSITTSGGTESQLFFAAVGDTRPPNEDDTSGYPTAIIDTIYSDLDKFSPRPPFVVGTGDYQYSNPTGTQSATQLGYYQTAMKGYGGIVFPTMGNHECTGYTASNCGAGTTDGITNNYSNFMSMLLSGISSTPYYSINVNASDSSWTAKFVFVAANAWTATQSSWFTTTLATKTTYTFIIRHEEASATTAPGVSPSQAIMASYPYTLAIVGHSHEYQHSSSREVIVGNGGAPISTSQDYGYAIIQRLSSGNVQVDMFDYMTNTADPSFEFTVTP